MYYGSIGQNETGRDLMAEAREILEGSCYSYSLDKCLWPEGWDNTDPNEAAMPLHPDCELLKAARMAGGEEFTKLQDSLPYCTYDECKMPHEATYATIGIAAAALGVGILFGAWAL